MKIYIYTLLIVALSFNQVSANDSDVYEITPLHTDEINRSSLYGAEIGNGAVLGADSIFCEDKDDFEGCYTSIQRILARAKREGEKLGSLEEYTKARFTLVFAIRESAKNLAINYDTNGGQLLSFLSRGLEFNKLFSGLCLEERSSIDCYRTEAKAAYSFLNSYFAVMLDNVYLLDTQLLVPWTRKMCGVDLESTKYFEAQLSNYSRLQSQLLRVVLNVPVNNERAPVNLGNSYYETKVASKIFENVSSDLQTDALGTFYNVSVSGMIGISEEIKRNVSIVANSKVRDSLMDDSKRVAAQAIFDLDSSGFNKYLKDLPRVNCKVRISN